MILNAINSANDIRRPSSSQASPDVNRELAFTRKVGNGLDLQGARVLVGTVKKVLFSLTILIIGLVFTWPHLNAPDSKFKLNLASISTNGDDQPRLYNARYIGIDDKARPYTVSADLATALDTEVTEVELEHPKVDITLENGEWLILTSKTGHYLRQQGIIDLSDEVSLFHDAGYELHTEELRIDLAQGTAKSITPVEAQGSFGNLQAEGLELLDRGKRITFTGKSFLVLYPENDISSLETN